MHIILLSLGDNRGGGGGGGTESKDRQKTSCPEHGFALIEHIFISE